MRRTLFLVLAALAASLFSAQAALANPIGDQFKVSTMGTDGDVAFEATDPAVAYNSRDNETLFVWHGDNDTDGHFEIWGQRVGPTGNLIGGEFQISQVSSGIFNQNTSTCTDYPGACDPDVAYNSTSNEYMVVFEGHLEPVNSTIGPATVGQGTEILAQRLSATGAELDTGTSTGSTDEEITDRDVEVLDPKIAYNATNNEYMTTMTDTAEEVILAQRLSAQGDQLDTGGETGEDEEEISEMRNEEDSDVVHNSQTNQYQVAWRADELNLGEADSSIFGQLLTAGGTEVGTDDFPISTTNDAEDPALAYNPVTNQVLAVFEADSDGESKDEIFGHRITAAGVPIEPSDFKISTTQPVSDSDFQSEDPAVDADRFTGEYLVVWQKDLVLGGGKGIEEIEVFGQLLNGEGGQIGTDDFQISSMGTSGDTDFDGDESAVAYTTCEYMTAWAGDISREGEDEEDEIHGRRVAGNPSPCPSAAPVAAPQPGAQARPARPRVRVAGVRRACVRRSFRVRFRISTASGVTIRSVRLTVDGRRVRTRTRSRFSVRIPVARLRAGRHRLRLVVTDSAGNRTVLSRRFTKCAQRAQRRAAPRFTG